MVYTPEKQQEVQHDGKRFAGTYATVDSLS
jgi:hypothetical protein